MKCLYCDKAINRYSLYSLFIEKDKLCIDCREKLKIKYEKFKIEDLECISIYEYDSLFKTLLLQYKECYDEALKDIFLFGIEDLIKLKYLGYKIAYVPSSKEKEEARGFNHLKLIFENLGFEEVKGLKMKEELIQEGKNLIERRRMIDNYTYEGEKISKLLIVDDVCTTGSSLLGVYNAFKDKVKTIKALVLGKKKALS